MFLLQMRRETVTIPVGRGIDWKGIGYLFSIAGALALGAVACSAPHPPAWYLPTLALGVATTIIGFGVRYVAHLKEKREIEETRRKAERKS
ncbi:MAG TPA: hypothetical protein VLM36_02765 [Sphingomicrobium sp.]|nr:hypothetical protein [Sphingomicrobium sp.]